MGSRLSVICPAYIPLSWVRRFFNTISVDHPSDSSKEASIEHISIIKAFADRQSLNTIPILMS
jgi:hypothetical protein